VDRRVDVDSEPYFGFGVYKAFSVEAGGRYLARSMRRLLGGISVGKNVDAKASPLRFVIKRHVVGRVIDVAIGSSRSPSSPQHPPPHILHLHVKLFLLRTQQRHEPPFFALRSFYLFLHQSNPPLWHTRRHSDTNQVSYRWLQRLPANSR
jgi:hypothetical protein